MEKMEVLVIDDQDSIREMGHEVYFAFVTGRSEEEDKIKSLGTNFFVKPYDREVFRETLKEVIDFADFNEDK